MKKNTIEEASPSRLSKTMQGFFALGISILILLSLLSFADGDPKHNCLGLLGHALAWGLHYLLGLNAFLLPLYLGWEGGKHLLQRSSESPKKKLFFFCLLLLSLSVLLSMLSAACPQFASLFDKWVYSNIYPSHGLSSNSVFRHFLGGVPFYYLTESFNPLIGRLGCFLIFLALAFLSLAFLTKVPVFLAFKLLSFTKGIFARKEEKKASTFSSLSLAEEKIEELPALSRSHPLSSDSPSKFQLKKTTKKEEPKDEKAFPSPPQLPPSKEMEGYILPSSSLLTQAKKQDSSLLKNDLKRLSAVLEETLLSFGIEAKVGDIHCGPTITLFEVHPAIGVKVQKIKTLENDIALNMQAKSIRIIAPIPGKAAVGIEVPNPLPQEVSFRELIENYQAGGKKGHIPLLLGKAVNGEDVWVDLTKMPHGIIAGATGSGKSVCINTIVMSILMNARPDEIKLVMVDPKKVELTAYTRLPHMLAPVITEPGEAHAALNWLVKEMERRYEIFRQVGIRNILGFNSRAINEEIESSLEIEVPERLPYIVVIVDELADLMMVSSSDIETPIARIAQMARAVGIHMLLATQRPSREVITGLIKANFPTRISFKVANRVNSQIVIDENGAEALLGNGDMLFIPPGSSSLVRAQGAFIRDEDINKVIDFICAQLPTRYLIPSFHQFRDESEQKNGNGGGSGEDPLYEEAKRLVLETGTASTTFLQRKLKIGYARAASLMDELEGNGIIGPQEGAKPRKIFYPDSSRQNENED